MHSVKFCLLYVEQNIWRIFFKYCGDNISDFKNLPNRGHVQGLGFTARFKFWNATSGWQELLFAVNVWGNAWFCGFYWEIFGGHMADVVTVLPLRLTLQIQELKFNVETKKKKSSKYKSTIISDFHVKQSPTGRVQFLFFRSFWLELKKCSFW